MKVLSRGICAASAHQERPEACEAGLAQQGMAVAPSDSATAHMAAGQGVPLTPSQVAPALAAGRGWSRLWVWVLWQGKALDKGKSSQFWAPRCVQR